MPRRLGALSTRGASKCGVRCTLKGALGPPSSLVSPPPQIVVTLQGLPSRLLPVFLSLSSTLGCEH